MSSTVYLAAKILKQERAARRVIRGLLQIAAIAMPTTMYATDSRVKAANKWLKENKQ